MTELETPDPPEDAPPPADEGEEILRERAEDIRGLQPGDEGGAVFHSEQGPSDR